MKSSAARRLAALASLTPLLLATGNVATAQARTGDTNLCNNAPLSQPFAAWGDSSQYELAPGGDFESASWQLSNGAALVSGSELFAATGTLGASSLSLPAGASAQSPATCLNAAYPTMRMFVRGTGTVAVQVVYDGKAYTTGVVRGGGSWSPSQVLRTGGALFGTLSGGTAQVNLRLTALNGDAAVDDVFIDPWNRG